MLVYRLMLDHSSLPHTNTSYLPVRFSTIFREEPYYKYISNYYTRIYVQDPTHKNITIKGYSNIPEATNVGAEVNIDQEITKSWKANLSGNIYRNSIFGYTGEIDFPTPVKYIINTQRDNPWFLKANNLFSISPRVRCEVGGVYFSNKAIAQGNELSRWALNFGLRTLWLNNKLEITLSASDIFNRMGIRQQVNQGGGYYTYYQNFYETQLISLGAKYKF